MKIIFYRFVGYVQNNLSFKGILLSFDYFWIGLSAWCQGKHTGMLTTMAALHKKKHTQDFYHTTSTFLSNLVMTEW